MVLSARGAVGALVDPRVARTKALVLRQARELLGREGMSAMTYSSLSIHTGVTRQTLYRHWPTIDALVRDIALSIPPVTFAQAEDVRGVLIGFLRGVRDQLADRTIAASLLALISAAEHDTQAADLIKKIVTDQASSINRMLKSSGQSVSSSQLSRLVGPLLFRRLFQRAAVNNKFIDDVVDSWLAAQ